MDINEFLGISIIGVLLSLSIEMLTSHVSNPLMTKFVTAILAILVAGAYVWVRSTPYFQTVILVLGVASTVYGFFLNRKTK
jgi:hypothetical protein